MNVKQVKANFKELKKHGKMINGELHLKPGIYCKYSPIIDDSCIINTKKKETTNYNG